MKIAIQYFHHPDGTTTVVDERLFHDCVAHQLKYIRETAKEQILEVAPEHKQRNAALGLLDSQETETIKTHIQTIRNNSNQKEAQILSINWDGTEETRSAACDAVQAVTW